MASRGMLLPDYKDMLTTSTFKRKVPREAEATEWEGSVQITSRGMERRCLSMAVHHLHSHGDVLGVLSESIHERSSHEL